jgi:hypothetical protein
VFPGHDLLPGKTEVTRMNGLTFHNSVPCMIMDVVEGGATSTIGLVAWNRKQRRQRQRQHRALEPYFVDRVEKQLLWIHVLSSNPQFELNGFRDSKLTPLIRGHAAA